MRGIKDKMIAGAGTVGFMALVTTNSNPKLWQIALIGILIYESALLAVKTSRRQAYKERKRKNIEIRNKDAERWWNTRIGWPMKEVI